MLKECLEERLRDTDRTLSDFANSQKQNQKSLLKKKQVISGFNNFLKNAGTLSSGHSHRLDFSKGHNGSSIKTVFTEHTLIRMLNASDFEPIHQVSPFLRASKDFMCGNSYKPALKELFTFYFELSKFVRRGKESQY